jgi:NitT/TauT family transport system permease protein
VRKLSLGKLLPPLIPLVVIIVLLDSLRHFGIVSEYLLPSPGEVFSSLVEDRAELTEGFLSTAFASLIGLFLSFVLGTTFAVLLSLSKFLRRAIYPYAIFFQTVPIIAIAPLLVIWFGFGRPTVIVSAFIVSVFPIVASTLLGLESTEPALVDLFKLYSASGRAVMWKLRIPFALPQIFSGLRIASGLSVIGAIVGEFIGGGGLGAVVDAARTQQRIDKVFAAVLLSALLGLLMVAFINVVSTLSLRSWHASARDL